MDDEDDEDYDDDGDYHDDADYDASIDRACMAIRCTAVSAHIPFTSKLHSSAYLSLAFRFIARQVYFEFVKNDDFAWEVLQKWQDGDVKRSSWALGLILGHLGPILGHLGLILGHFFLLGNN